MVSKPYGVLAVALALVLVGAGAAVLGAPAAIDGALAQENDSAGDEPAADAAQTGQLDEPTAASCDYVDLYDRTIDSVVAVRANGGLGSGFVYRVGAADDGAATDGGQIDDGATNETATGGAGNATTAGETNASATYVVTNAHVVSGADSVAVQFAQGETASGEVVGRDVGTDLAVVRVTDAPEYTEALPVANASPEEGRKVAAMGSPFGLDQTITHGIVSGTNRSMPTQQGYSIPNVIQTDAPINPGNSGGPLVSCNGTVVGVNSAGLAASSAEDVGFAISSSTVEQVVPALIEDGEYEHAYLGVQTIPTGPALLQANEFETGGVYVHAVPEGSPSADVLQGTSGFEVVQGARVPVGGDLIVAVEGTNVTSGEELSSYLLSETRPRDEVQFTVVRDGERQQVSVELGQRPEPEATPLGPGQQPGGSGAAPSQTGGSPGGPVLP